MLLNCIECLAPLSATVILSFLVNFGRNSFNYRTVLYAAALLIILKRMAKPKSLITHWKDIWGVLLVTSLLHGLIVCLGLNGGIILHSILLSNWLLLKQSMVGPPRIESYLPSTTNVHAIDLALLWIWFCIFLKIIWKLPSYEWSFLLTKKRTERVFAEGDWVYLRVQPYRQSTLHPNGTHKLSPHYYGPFWILSSIGTVAYKLDLLATSKVYPVFHVSCLKRKLDSPYVVAWKWQPLAILDHGIFKRNNRLVTKLLVQWQG